MRTEIISVFTKREDIERIVDRIRIFKFEELGRHRHFEFSVDEKLVDMEEIKETFSSFELIKSIEIRENEKKQKHYSLNYELKDGTFVVISLSFNLERPMIINAFHVKRNYKNFEKSLRKNYSKKFI